MDVREHNRQAWNRYANASNEWTVPVTGELLEAARYGDWSIVLTNTKPVPREWLGGLTGARVLGLASGGGQQGPILAAAGAWVTVLDLSDEQLARDAAVAAEHDLTLDTVQGDMRDLSAFGDETFDLIVHPVSNCFVPEVQPMWDECARVLRPGGRLLAGSLNPVSYVFDESASEEGRMEVRHKLPFSDLESLPEDERRKLLDAGEALMWSHSLEDLIGGQARAGLAITGLYEDHWPGKAYDEYFPSQIATRAEKLSALPLR
jgi:SAM-dependent methyltransferase